MSAFVSSAVLSHVSSDDIELHSLVQDMPQLPVARFTRLPDDDRIFAFACDYPVKDEPAGVLVSSDGGQTWQPTGPFRFDRGMIPTDSGIFIGTSRGTLIIAFSNYAEKANWNWDPVLKDSPGATLPLYASRSEDKGKTWSTPVMLQRPWTGASRDIIETRNGRIVFTTTRLVHNPGRHCSNCFTSDDDGRTWAISNVIDLGGNGDHDGVSEATLIELDDGTLLKYMRTPWGKFWRAMSHDNGTTWHPYGPTNVLASSAPGIFRRLASGRIMFAWNRPAPEGQTDWPTRGGDGAWSSTPASTYREELSIAFSEDQCATWSTPVVIARKQKTEVAYPEIFEPVPGEIWVTAHRYKLRAKLFEKDFVSQK